MRIYVAGPSTGPGSTLVRIALVLIGIVIGLALLAIALVLLPVLVVVFFLFRARAKRTWREMRQSPPWRAGKRPDVIEGEFTPKT